MASAIKHFPTETLVEIFTLIDESIDRRHPDASKHSLLNILLVCRHWKAIVTSTPSFWTTVWFGDRQDAMPSGSERAENLRKHLERSGDTLLMDVIVHADADAEEVLEVLDPYIDRWATLTFLPNVGDDPVDVHAFFRDSPFCLHTVDIRMEGVGQGTFISINGAGLENLRCMNQEVYFKEVTPLISLTLMGEIDPDNEYHSGKGGTLPLETLEDCQDTLEFLSLNADWFHHDYEINLEFPDLHTLRLSEWSMSASIFLHRASFPALRNLHVGWRVEVTDYLYKADDIAAFPTFPLLHELQWEGTQPERITPLRILLASTPNLQILSDKDVPGADGEGGALIDALMDEADASAPTLCPMLRELHIRRASAEELDRLTAVKERPALKTISVHTLTDDEESDAETILKRVRDRGVELRIGGRKE